MATVDLLVTNIIRAGVAPTYTALGAGDTNLVINDGNTFLHFKKTGVGACTVTVTAVATVDGLAVTNLTFVVPASTGDVMAGPFRPEVYNDPTTGKITFQCSDVVGLTVARMRIPR